MALHRNRMIYRAKIILLSFLLASCSGGNGGFSGLVGGDISDVNELTITSTTPAGNDIIIQIGQSQAFTIMAEAPPPGTVSYSFELDGTTVSNINAYTFTGTALNVGNHIVTAIATAASATKSKQWNVKVNGPPSITSSYSNAPKVAVGSILNLTVTATDPNNDPLTFDWKINGLSNTYLVGTTNSAVLTANSALLPSGFAGPIAVSVTATDDSGGSATHNFNVEINAFSQACNELQQYDMCTYVGTPTLGDGYNPLDPDTSSTIKLGPIAIATDDRNNNLIISDWNHNLVWYWNKTSSAVELLQFKGANAIPANTIKVIAGTGEAASETGDDSLLGGVNGPRGLYYSSSLDRLYIAEYSSARVKIVGSNGVTSYGLGAGGGHVDGQAATLHTCSQPSGMSFYNNELYVACRNHHRVKAWNLITNAARTVYGNAPANVGTAATFKNDRSIPVIPQSYGAGTEDGKAYTACGANCGYQYPYDVHVDATGLYVTHPDNNYARYCNFSGASRTVLGMNIGNNFCRSILGDGTTGFTSPVGPATSVLATSAKFQGPRGITVDNNRIFVTTLDNSDRIAVINDTGATIPSTVFGVEIADDHIGVITGVGAGYSEGSNIITKRFNNPYDIIMDPDEANSLIVADYDNKRVRKLSYNTDMTTSLVGSGRLRTDLVGDTGLASEFYLNTPSGLVFDNQTSVNSLFVMDANNDRLLRVDQYGNVTTAAGGGTQNPNAVTGAQSPTSIQLNTDIVLFTGLAMFKDFSMVLNNAVYSHLQVWNRSGATKTYLNGTTTGNNRVNQLAGDFANTDSPTPANYADSLTNPMLVSLANPSGVTVSDNADGSSEVFVVDQYRHCIRRVFESAPGVYGMDTVVGECKNGSAVNNTGAEGGFVSSDSEVPNSHLLYRPVDIVTHYPSDDDITSGGGTIGDYNGKGNLIISDFYNNRIRYWNRSGTSVEFASTTIPDGTVVTIGCTAGANNTSDGIFATGAQCSGPTAFAINDDYLCYSQNSKHNVRCIHLRGTQEGRIFTAAGSPQNNTVGVSGLPYNFDSEGNPATSQRMSQPTGLAFDPNGDLYISDQGNSLVRKVKLSP